MVADRRETKEPLECSVNDQPIQVTNDRTSLTSAVFHVLQNMVIASVLYFLNWATHDRNFAV